MANNLPLWPQDQNEKITIMSCRSLAENPRLYIMKAIVERAPGSTPGARNQRLRLPAQEQHDHPEAACNKTKKGLAVDSSGGNINVRDESISFIVL
jgi:hypothetical protein